PAADAAATAPAAAEGQPAPAVENPATAETAAAGQPPATGAAPAARSRNYWTQFRGPARDGRYEELMVKTSWPSGGLAPLWRQPVGGGFASFSVADGVAYTIEQRRGQEVVTAYQVETGRELWTHGWDANFRDSTGDGPRATPTWDNGRLYALGATGELRCLDARTGRALWSKNILSDNGASNAPWGMAASPLVVDDKVVVIAGGPNGRSVVAYNKMTGARAWGALGDAASYTSPMLVTLAGRRQVLAVTAARAAGLAPEDGSVLWEFPWSNSAGINVSQPVVVDANRFFISAGYGKGAALVEVGGAGKALTARAVWQNSSMKNKFNSPVYHEGHVYGLDEGILTCVEAATGERKWKGGRYGYGQVVLAAGHLIVTTDAGEIVLLRATPQAHTEVARFQALDGQTWNNPAIAAGRLLVRNGKEMACYKLTD
ncbi:MAG TPA: PQQ-binding-like beta-propeller repeat protein, partial [Pyrinomonadaceae bacterium]|nr:PQQ-binding-like beta-propeller repeat protein [Pyrinomonadaceae bacterium]